MSNLSNISLPLTGGLKVRWYLPKTGFDGQDVTIPVTRVMTRVIGLSFNKSYKFQDSNPWLKSTLV